MRVFFDSLQSKEIAIFMERYPLSEDIAAHNHDFIEMAYVLEGTVQRSNGKPVRRTQGLFYFRCRYPIFTTRREGVSGDQLHFLPAFIDSSLHVYRDLTVLSSIIWFTLTSGLISAL
ncbi:MAG: hypothetical protein ACLSB9_11550 [Hydrogeniiclostridium mannosilyticum]